MKLLLILLTVASSTSMAADWSYTNQIATIISKQGDISAAESTANAARERNSVARWTYLPTASLEAKRSLIQSRLSDPNSFRETDTTASVNLNLFRFGADHALKEKSSLQYEASIGRTQIARLEGEAKAAQLINEAIAANMEADVYKRRLSTQSQVIAASEARFRKGMLSEQELTKLKLEASSLALTMNAANRKAQKTVSLVTELGAVMPDPVIWPVSNRPNASISIARVREWMAQLKQDPIDVRVSEAAAGAAEAAVREARGSMLPSIDAAAAWSRSLVDNAPAYVDQKQYYVSLTVPLFSKFSDWGEYRARAEEASAASATLDAARIKSSHEFTHEKILLQALFDEATERDKNIDAADKLFHDNLLRFERGLISVNDLSIDEFRLREAELESVRTWQSLHNEMFQLARVAGNSVLSAMK